VRLHGGRGRCGLLLAQVSWRTTVTVLSTAAPAISRVPNPARVAQPARFTHATSAVQTSSCPAFWHLEATLVLFWTTIAFPPPPSQISEFNLSFFPIHQHRRFRYLSSKMEGEGRLTYVEGPEGPVRHWLVCCDLQCWHALSAKVRDTRFFLPGRETGTG
jgi:hypothetical protein